MNIKIKWLNQNSLLGLLVFCCNIPLFAQIAPAPLTCTTFSTNERLPFYTFTATIGAPRAVKNMSCTYLGFSATNTTSKRIYVSDPKDVMLSTYLVSGFATSQVYDGPMAIELNPTTKAVTIKYYNIAGTTVSGTNNPGVTPHCKNGDGFYVQFTRPTTGYPAAYQSDLNATDCLVSNINYYCDSAGNPFTQASHACSVATTGTAALCGNASLDAGEECDLGTAINNDTEAGSFGCKKNCTRHDGWTCTKDIGEYKVKEQEAATLYAGLVTAQASFTTNVCGSYYAGDTTKETACYAYQENLRKFKELNKIIKVTCPAATTTNRAFKERPAASGQAAPADYAVQCL